MIALERLKFIMLVKLVLGVMVSLIFCFLHRLKEINLYGFPATKNLF